MYRGECVRMLHRYAVPCDLTGDRALVGVLYRTAHLPRTVLQPAKVQPRVGSAGQPANRLIFSSPVRDPTLD